MAYRNLLSVHGISKLPLCSWHIKTYSVKATEDTLPNEYHTTPYFLENHVRSACISRFFVTISNKLPNNANGRCNPIRNHCKVTLSNTLVEISRFCLKKITCALFWGASIYSSGKLHVSATFVLVKKMF